MAVYYKFKSAKDYVSIPIVGHFISVFNLKQQIFESKHLGKGKDFDLILTNAQTNEEYQDEDMMIPKNTSVLVRRVPGRPRMPIVIERKEVKVEENKLEDAQPAKSNFSAVDSSFKRYSEEIVCDELINDFYDIPKGLPFQSSIPSQDAPPLDQADEDSKIQGYILNKADEDSKIKALNDTLALDWQRQPQEGFGTGRGFGRVLGGRPTCGRGFGQGGLEWKTPPEGYICHRCKVPGHLIQHCPTNGDPSYDVKRMKPPTGIPKSMLIPTPDGSYALSSGTVAVLTPNEAAFEKEVEGLPSTRLAIDIPPELRCPLCKEVMRDAVLTSKCCFQSFCDKCIRGHIISKSICICGATNILADDLVPNKTVRETITSILETNISSSENTRSTHRSQESARFSLPKVPSPTLSATSTREKRPSPCKEDTPDANETLNEGKPVDAPQQSFEKGRTAKTADISEAKIESVKMKEQCNAPPEQQKLTACEPEKKKRKKKILPVNAGNLLHGTSQGMAAQNYMMPFAPSTYNPYWGGMQFGMDGYMAPYNGYIGYNPGPYGIPTGGMLPQGHFGGQGYLLPGVPSQRDLSEYCVRSNPACPVMNRESEAQKFDVRKHEIEQRDPSREYLKGREFDKEEVIRSCDVSSMKSKLVQKPTSHAPAKEDHHHHNHRDDWSERSNVARRSRVVSNHEESSDGEEKNFKRRRTWYESSSSAVEVEKKDLLRQKRRSSSRDDHEDLRGSHYERRDNERRTWAREQRVLG